MQQQSNHLALDAITYATQVLPDFEALNFLPDFLNNNLAPWPDFTDWVAARKVEGHSNVTDNHLQTEN